MIYESTLLAKAGLVKLKFAHVRNTARGRCILWAGDPQRPLKIGLSVRSGRRVKVRDESCSNNHGFARRSAYQGYVTTALILETFRKTCRHGKLFNKAKHGCVLFTEHQGMI